MLDILYEMTLFYEHGEWDSDIYFKYTPFSLYIIFSLHFSYLNSRCMVLVLNYNVFDYNIMFVIWIRMFVFKTMTIRRFVCRRLLINFCISIFQPRFDPSITWVIQLADVDCQNKCKFNKGCAGACMSHFHSEQCTNLTSYHLWYDYIVFNL